MDKIISSSQVNERHSISHLLMSEKLRESGSPKLIILSIVMIFFILLMILAWAYFVEIDEITSGRGEILPASKIQLIQHLEGGIVLDVDVKDGDIVKKGQVLFKLNPASFVADLNRWQKRQNSLELEIFRLQAVLNRNAALPDSLIDAITYKDVTEPALLRLQFASAQMLHRQQMQQREYKKGQIESRINQEKSNLENLSLQIYHLEQRKKLLEDEVGIFGTLSEQQATSKLNLLSTQNRLQEVIGDMLEIIKEQSTLKLTIIDLENQLQNFDFSEDSLVLEELNDLTSSLLEVREQVTRSKDRVNRLESKAPVAGIVKGLSIMPGSVIAPAEQLFNIVPISEKLIAKIRISTSDIGHVKLGAPVQVKVDTYDFSSYGQISGEVKAISASTFMDEQGNPYYTASIKLDKNYLGNIVGENIILPGMTVTGDIKTEKKSLLKYLLKPINRTFTDAFRER